MTVISPGVAAQGAPKPPLTEERLPVKILGASTALAQEQQTKAAAQAQHVQPLPFKTATALSAAGTPAEAAGKGAILTVTA